MDDIKHIKRLYEKEELWVKCQYVLSKLNILF